MNQSPLSNIKPEYSHLVKYSAPDDPLLELPDMQQQNESAYPDDEPLGPLDKEGNAKWARELRRAAESK